LSTPPPTRRTTFPYTTLFRSMIDRNALRKGLKVLRNNQVLGLFPEGTRSRTGKLGKPLAGAGFFALRSEAVDIPCAIIGPYRPLDRKSTRLHSSHVSISYAVI